jgi:hypothetical protein
MYRKHFSLFFTLLTISSYTLSAQEAFNYDSPPAAPIVPFVTLELQRQQRELQDQQLEQDNSARSSTQTSRDGSFSGFLFLVGEQSSISNSSSAFDEQSSTSNSSLLSTASLEQDYQDFINQNQNDQTAINDNGRRVINNQGQQERNTRQRTGSPLPVARLF